MSFLSVKCKMLSNTWPWWNTNYIYRMFSSKDKRRVISLLKSMSWENNGKSTLLLFTFFKHLEKKCFMKSYFCGWRARSPLSESQRQDLFGAEPLRFGAWSVCYWGDGVCCEEKMMMGDDLNVRRGEYNKNKGLRCKRPPINCST